MILVKARVIAALFLAAASAHAVILYRTGDPSENTTEPTGADYANSGWQYEGNWGALLGTPFAPQFFLSAAHIGRADDFFYFQNVAYHVGQSFYDPQGDFVIWKVAETFPSFAPLYSRTDEVGLRMISIGRGTQRGSPVMLNNVLKGWTWGGSDGVRRWGENIVSGIYPNGPNNDLLYANFDQAGLPNECHLSAGDSGGAAFIQDGAVWKLAGIHYSVDGHFSFDSLGSNHFDAALFDKSGLYEGDLDYGVPYTAATGPSALYPTRISTKLPWICAVVAEPKPAKEGSDATLTYTKLIFPPTDLVYLVQKSSDLVSWTDAGGTDELVSTAGSSQVVKSKVPIPAGDGAIFLRLQIKRAPAN